MSNLVEIAKDLEYVPDEQLIQLANGSDPRFPPFVVISEIKRRTDMRSRASEPMPKTTVAQEMVQEFAMPSRQGLEGMSQDTTGILPPTVYNRDMPSSMMADGGLVGYATGDETKYRGKINQLVGRELGAIEPRTLSEKMSETDKSRRFERSQQIGRLINNPDNPLNKFFRYIPDGQQISNYLLGRRGEDFTPDVRRPTDKPKNKKQEGGLTGYQTGNQTALSNTFMYTPAIGGNIPYSPQGIMALTGITDMDEIGQLYSALNIPRKDSLFRYGLEPVTEVLRKSDEARSQIPYGPLETPPDSFRYEVAEELLEGKSPGPMPPNMLYNFVKKDKRTKTNSDNNTGNTIEFVNPEDDDNLNKEETSTGLASVNPEFELPEPPKPPTAADRQKELNANVLMSLGSAIGSSATTGEIFQKLSGLPQQVAAIKNRQKQDVKDYTADLRANIKDKANYEIALKKLDVSIEAAKNSKNTALVNYLGELKDLYSESTDESERAKLMRQIDDVSNQIFSTLLGQKSTDGDVNDLNKAIETVTGFRVKS